MKYSNGDMDDLFRRAAERYPLRTDSADWDRLSGALDGEPVPPSEEEEKRRRRGIFWWFLLVPLAGIGYLTWQVGVRHTSDKGITSAQAGSAARTGAAARPDSTAYGISAARTDAGDPAVSSGSARPDVKGAATPVVSGAGKPNGSGAGKPNGSGAGRPVVTGAPTPVVSGAGTPVVSGAGTSAVASDANPDRPTANRIGNVNSDRPTANHSGTANSDLTTAKRNANVNPDRTNTSNVVNSNTPVTGDAPNGNDVTSSRKKKVNASKRSKGRNLRNPGESETNVGGSTTAGSTPSQKYGSVNAAFDHDPALAPLDLRRAPIGYRNRIAIDVVAPPSPGSASAATASNGQTDASASATRPGTPPKKPTPDAKTAHAYIGIFGAPDFSEVRFQKMTGVGTTYGVLLGYSFNKRWAVESGLYLDRKRYYTNGEYFNTESVHLPPNSTLLNVDGTCYMWEIPVNVRYNFTTGPGMKWFGTAGLSNYLMSKERYTYEYQYTGPWGPNGDSLWNIHKPSQYWFSVVNLSVGFEKRIGKVGNLRLEPYVRIPLSGIGTGRLSILSSGVNIGFTRQLW